MIEDFLALSQQVDLSSISVNVLNLTTQEKNKLKKAGYDNLDDIAQRYDQLNNRLKHYCGEVAIKNIMNEVSRWIEKLTSSSYYSSENIPTGQRQEKIEAENTDSKINGENFFQPSPDKPSPSQNDILIPQFKDEAMIKLGETLNVLQSFNDDDLSLIQIDELDLPMRVYNGLRRAGFETLRDLKLKKNTIYRAKIGNWGEKSTEIFNELFLKWLENNSSENVSTGERQLKIGGRNTDSDIVGEDFLKLSPAKHNPSLNDRLPPHYNNEAMRRLSKILSVLKFFREDDLALIDITELDLPTRIYNGLRRTGIETFKDLKTKQDTVIRGDIRNWGEKSTEVFIEIFSLWREKNHSIIPTQIGETEISESFLASTSQPESSTKQAHVNKKEEIDDISINASSLQKSLQDLFSHLTPRENSVIKARYGDAENQKTLQTISDEFGVTRERVRQIESKALRKLRGKIGISNRDLFFDFVLKCVTENNGVLSKTSLINELQINLDLPKPNVEQIFSILTAIYTENFSVKYSETKILFIEELEAYITDNHSAEDLVSIAKFITQALTSSLYPLPTESIYSSIIEENKNTSINEDFIDSILNCLADNQTIQFENNGWFLLKKIKQNRSEKIKIILREIGKPLHFSEITEYYNQYYPDEPKSKHNMNAILTGSDDFVRIGRGKYGLAEWGLQNDGNVANAVRRILASNNHPMSLQEIEWEVRKTWDIQNNTVLVAIETDARFKKNNMGLIELTDYGLKTKKRKKKDDVERLDRVYDVIKEIGIPVTVKKIVETHNVLHPSKPLKPTAVRQLMARKTDLFMRTGFKEYGLVIWGLEPYTEPEQNTATNILDIIQEFGPLKFSALYERYNQKFPNRQLSESGLRIYLGKLKDKIHKPSKDEYQVLNNSSMYFQSEQQQKQHTEYIHNLKMILNKISTPSHVDYIASIYQSMFPYQNKQHAEIRHTLYNEIKEFKSYGNEVFGLPEWNGSNE